MYSGNFLQIQNNTGSSVTFKGTTYANAAYVPIVGLEAYKVTGCKLWGSDTGRSMTGSNRGTLLGIFPKLSITLLPMTEDDMQTIIKLTDQAATTVKYYDVVSKTDKSNSFYFGDVQWEVLEANIMRFGSVEFSVIANERRT
jgi:hypothetical protein